MEIMKIEQMPLTGGVTTESGAPIIRVAAYDAAIDTIPTDEGIYKVTASITGQSSAYKEFIPVVVYVKLESATFTGTLTVTKGTGENINKYTASGISTEGVEYSFFTIEEANKAGFDGSSETDLTALSNGAQVAIDETSATLLTDDKYEVVDEALAYVTD